MGLWCGQQDRDKDRDSPLSTQAWTLFSPFFSSGFDGFCHVPADAAAPDGKNRPRTKFWIKLSCGCRTRDYLGAACSSLEQQDCACLASKAAHLAGLGMDPCPEQGMQHPGWHPWMPLGLAHC